MTSFHNICSLYISDYQHIRYHLLLPIYSIHAYGSLRYQCGTDIITRTHIYNLINIFSTHNNNETIPFMIHFYIFRVNMDMLRSWYAPLIKKVASSILRIYSRLTPLQCLMVHFKPRSLK